MHIKGSTEHGDEGHVWGLGIMGKTTSWENGSPRGAELRAAESERLQDLWDLSVNLRKPRRADAALRRWADRGTRHPLLFLEAHAHHGVSK